MVKTTHFLGYGERVKRNRFRARLMLLLSTIMIIFSITSVFAENLSNMTSGQTSEASNSTQSGLLKGLNDSVDFSEEDETVAKVKEPLKKAFGIIVQIGSYVLTFGIIAITVLDLVYVCIPPLQPLLSCGQAGKAMSGGQGGAGSPMGMGGMGGMSPMGMGGGMGMNRPGMGGGMGGQQQQAAGSFKWVTDNALNAVASSGMPGPNGKPMSALKVYAKEAMYTLVAAPVLLTLAVTGILGKLGFAIGALVGGIIQSAIGLLG